MEIYMTLVESLELSRNKEILKDVEILKLKVI